MLCKYKNLFGEPKKGIHSYRIYDIAVLDVLVTVFAGLIISYFTKINLFLVLIILFLSGIYVHKLFCVETTVDKLLHNNFYYNLL